MQILFLVVGALEAEPSVDPEDNELFPQWAIAVIVIGMASLAFVIVFGISMVCALAFVVSLNRWQFHKSSIFKLLPLHDLH